MVYNDNQSIIHLVKNPTLHSKYRHIYLRYHWIQQVLEEGHLYLEKIHIVENPADMLTKILARDKQELCRSLACLGVT